MNSDNTINKSSIEKSISKYKSFINESNTLIDNKEKINNKLNNEL